MKEELKTISHNEVPQAITHLSSQVAELTQLFLTWVNNPAQLQDRWMDLTELCSYHPEKPVKATVYDWIHQKKIPFHRRGKKLYFLQSEIDLFLKEGKQMTMQDIAASADELIVKNKKKSIQ